MSFDRGVVEYRATMKCNGVVPSQRMIETSIQYPVVLLECFGEGIGDILAMDARKDTARNLPCVMPVQFNDEGDKPSGKRHNNRGEIPLHPIWKPDAIPEEDWI